MKKAHLLLALAICVLSFATTRHAFATLQATQCDIGGTSSAFTDNRPCVAAPDGAVVKNDISHFNSVRTEAGKNAVGAIEMYGKCRYIDNATGASYFGPFSLVTEWSAFTSHPPFTLKSCARPYLQPTYTIDTSAVYPQSDPSVTVAAPSRGGVMIYGRTGDTWSSPIVNLNCRGGKETVQVKAVWTAGASPDGSATGVTAPDSSWGTPSAFYGPDIDFKVSDTTTNAAAGTDIVINSGDNVQLSWISSGSIAGHSPNWNGTNGATVTPAADTTYTITLGTLLQDGTTLTTAASVTVHVHPIGQCGNANGQQYTSKPTSDLCAANSDIVPPGVTGTDPWNWTCTRNGVSSPTCTAQSAFNGKCDPAAATTVSMKPANGACAKGTVTGFYNPSTNVWKWTCQGSGAGHTDDTCTADYVSVTGQCGSDDGATLNNLLNNDSNLCAAGGVSNFQVNNPPTQEGAWTWSCNGTDAFCGAQSNSTSPVDGQCGSSNDQSFNAQPGTNLCNGTSYNNDISGSGPWTWSCAGQNGGNPVSCVAQLDPGPICVPVSGAAINLGDSYRVGPVDDYYTISTPTLNVCNTLSANGTAFTSGHAFVVTTDNKSSSWGGVLRSWNFVQGVQSHQTYTAPGSKSTTIDIYYGYDHDAQLNPIDPYCSVYATITPTRTNGTNQHKVGMKLSNLSTPGKTCLCTPVAFTYDNTTPYTAGNPPSVWDPNTGTYPTYPNIHAYTGNYFVYYDATISCWGAARCNMNPSTRLPATLQINDICSLVPGGLSAGESFTMQLKSILNAPGNPDNGSAMTGIWNPMLTKGVPFNSSYSPSPYNSDKKVTTTLDYDGNCQVTMGAYYDSNSNTAFPGAGVELDNITPICP